MAARLAASGWAAARGAAWVERQRRRHRPRAVTLTEAEQAALGAWFEPATLDAVRVRRLGRIAAPGPVALLERLGPVPVAFDRVWGITYVDTVLLATEAVPPGERLPGLFHECVHVDQYRRLGTTGFVRRYLEEWAAGGFDYAAIGLEREAYALQRRFVAGDAPGPGQ